MPPHWIDTHCHLDAPEFAPDRDLVRAQASAAGVCHIVIPAVAPAHWRATIELAHRHGDSYALGIHPLYTPTAQESDIPALRALLHSLRDDPHLVAIGEVGLDHFVPGLDRARQQWFFEQQVRIARELGLPLILHVRRSCDAVLHTLRRHQPKPPPPQPSTSNPAPGGIAHAFNGSAQQAAAFTALGFKLGLGGAVTFERALHLRHLAASLPLHSIVLETDAPDIPPQWLYTPAHARAAGQPQGRNTSAELPRIAAHIAALRNIPPSELAHATTTNARTALRGLPALAHCQ